MKNIQSWLQNGKQKMAAMWQAQVEKLQKSGLAAKLLGVTGLALTMVLLFTFGAVVFVLSGLLLLIAAVQLLLGKQPELVPNEVIIETTAVEKELYKSP
ncbi:hypothetical protein SAMN05660772_02242 [Pasteurella testudinis DSM 23072]|uniref:Uncharacterized protein n=1 Tax=Pasteurella testudinis DSM 23072 TaxID=1122938 RepID=A0A1W1UQ06_9PAST|nr:hypothetical protein [Pasteurella testudinis]SMB83228.1 hypothetical protein SAMN05660772_02242 [Pasteurella testudinis DSM 23072]SUB50833.1 Uncharacterised protein [Pasteurella testudinis]